MAASKKRAHLKGCNVNSNLFYVGYVVSYMGNGDEVFFYVDVMSLDKLKGISRNQYGKYIRIERL